MSTRPYGGLARTDKDGEFTEGRAHSHLVLRDIRDFWYDFWSQCVAEHLEKENAMSTVVDDAPQSKNPVETLEAGLKELHRRAEQLAMNIGAFRVHLVGSPPPVPPSPNPAAKEDVAHEPDGVLDQWNVIARRTGEALIAAQKEMEELDTLWQTETVAKERE